MMVTTLVGSVYSMFAAAKKNVSAYYRVKKIFNTRSNHKNLTVGEVVYVREQLGNMKKQFNYIDPNRNHYPTKFTYQSTTNPLSSMFLTKRE